MRITLVSSPISFEFKTIHCQNYTRVMIWPWISFPSAGSGEGNRNDKSLSINMEINGIQYKGVLWPQQASHNSSPPRHPQQNIFPGHLNHMASPASPVGLGGSRFRWASVPNGSFSSPRFPSNLTQQVYPCRFAPSFDNTYASKINVRSESALLNKNPLDFGFGEFRDNLGGKSGMISRSLARQMDAAALNGQRLYGIPFEYM